MSKPITIRPYVQGVNFNGTTSCIRSGCSGIPIEMLMNDVWCAMRIDGSLDHILPNSALEKMIAEKCTTIVDALYDLCHMSKCDTDHQLVYDEDFVQVRLQRIIQMVAQMHGSYFTMKYANHHALQSATIMLSQSVQTFSPLCAFGASCDFYRKLCLSAKNRELSLVQEFFQCTDDSSDYHEKRITCAHAQLLLLVSDIASSMHKVKTVAN